MVSPAKKRFEKVQAAREAARAEAQEKARKAQEERARRESEKGKATKRNPFQKQASGTGQLSPAAKRFQQKLVQKESSASTPERPTGDAYELHLAAIIEDTRRLHDIQSIERKVEAKREMLPNYDGYVKGVLEAAPGQQDEVLMTLMVWYLDVGDFATGLDIAEYAVANGLETPDRYQRSTANLVAETVADYALNSEGEDPENEIIEAVQRTVDMFGESDMHDQVKAKLFKAYGYRLWTLEKPEEAKEALERALKLHDRVGVKKDIEALKKELKNSG